MSDINDKIFSSYLKSTALVRVKLCSNDLQWAMVQQLLRLSSAVDKVTEVEEKIIETFNHEDYINEFDLDDEYNLSDLFDENDPRVLVIDSELFTTMTLKNFAARDLYSIVINKNGNLKTRIFIHLSTNKMGFVPIHKHKYLDKFTPLFGDVTDIKYDIVEHKTGTTIDCIEYKYPRLSSSYDHASQTGNTKHLRISSRLSMQHEISFDDLHTVAADGFSAWMIEELSENLNFPSDPICYVPVELQNTNYDFVTTKASNSELEFLIKVLQQNGYIIKWK